MAKNRFVLGLVGVALLVACGVKRYDTFEAPAPTDDQGNSTFFNDRGLRATVSAVCDPKNGSNSFFVKFSATTTEPVTLKDVQVTESISYGARVRTIPSTDFTVRGLVRHSEDWSQDLSAEAPSVTALPESFLVISQAGSGSSFNQFSFSDVVASSSSPNTVSLAVTFVVAEGTILRRETRTIRLRKTPHRYFWFVRDC